MAGTRKTRSSGSAKKASPARKNTTKRKSTSKSRSTSKKAAAGSSGFAVNRRMTGLLLCLVVLLLTLSIAGLDGFLLRPLWTLCTGLIGWGIYLFTALLAVTALLLMSRIEPYRLRVLCVLTIPFLWSALVQCIQIGDSLPLSFSSVGTLWVTGVKLHSAGVISGVLALVSGAALSQTGAKIVLTFLLLVCIFAALRLTPWGLARQLGAMLAEDRETERLKEEDMTVSPREPAHRTDESETPTGNASFWTRRRAKVKQKKALRAIEKAERAQAEAERAARALGEEPAGYPGDESKRENSRRALERQRKLNEVMPQSLQPSGRNDRKAERPEDTPEPAATESPSGYPDIDRLMDWGSAPEEPAPAAPKRKSAKAVAEEAKAQVESEIASAMADLELPPYLPPSLDLLNKPPRTATDSRAELEQRAAQLLDTLDSFGIDARIVGQPIVGPTVTRFELQIERGIKISRITSLTDDLGLALGAPNVRISMVPEKGAIGIEVANRKSRAVAIREVIGSREFEQSRAQLPVALGKDITGQVQVIDLARMPHLMIAGTTGSGKSVCINTILVSLLYKYSSRDLRLIMIDPKMVELSNYNGIPHLLIPVVTDAKKASGALSWAVGEMDRRYALFAAEGVRKMEDYNALIRQREAEAAESAGAANDPDMPPFDLEDGDAGQAEAVQPSQVLPQIVIVIDELADLMMLSAKEVEGYICRLAQKARAAGMYLVVATQRPSADVITGLMKSNIPSRIAFAVASSMESRIILDTTGAEKLIGRGDMLYHPLGASKPTRIQGCFISTDEIERVIAHVKTTGTVEYSEEAQSHIEAAGGESEGGYNAAEDEDPMLQDAISIVVSAGQASTSLLQRRLKLGYARAARVMDQMEERGIVGPSEGSKPRRVLLSKDEWMEMQLRREI